MARAQNACRGKLRSPNLIRGAEKAKRENALATYKRHRLAQYMLDKIGTRKWLSGTLPTGTRIGLSDGTFYSIWPDGSWRKTSVPSGMLPRKIQIPKKKGLVTPAKSAGLIV